jgi:hypothetical protein
MRRFVFLIVLGGFLSFTLGCSGDEKAIAPKEVPPMPKGPPKAGEAAKKAGDTVSPVKP